MREQPLPKTLPPEVDYILSTEGHFGYIGTAGRDLAPHVTPVIFVYDGRGIFFATSKIAKKLKAIRENNRVAFLVDLRDPSDEYNNMAVMVTGRAKIYSPLYSLFHLADLVRVRRLFLHKYPKYFRAYEREKERIPKPWQTTLFLQRSLVRIAIEKYTFWRKTRRISL